MFEEHLRDLPAQPIELARRLSARSHVSLLWAKHGSVAYLGCDPVEHRHALIPDPERRWAAHSSRPALPRWVGLLIQVTGARSITSAPVTCIR